MGVPHAAGLVRVNLGKLPNRFGRRFRIVLVLQERAPEPHHAGSPGARDEEPALRQRTVVAGRQDQVFPTFTSVGPGQADVGDPAEPVVVDGAEKPGWHLQHHGPLGQIEDAEGIDGVRVGRQEQRLGVHQVGEDDDLVILDAGAQKAFVDGVDADALHRVHERPERVREVQVVVDLVQCVLARRAVLEFEHAESRLDLVGRGDRGRDCAGRLGGGQPWRCQQGAGCEDGQGLHELLHRFVSFAYGQVGSRVLHGRVRDSRSAARTCQGSGQLTS